MSTTPEARNRLEWEMTVKHHADRVRSLYGTKVFGWFIKDNLDAQIVAAFMAGVEEGKKNTVKVFEQMAGHSIDECLQMIRDCDKMKSRDPESD